MVSKPGSNIAKLVDHLMSKVSEVAEGEDWKEAEGWVGRWIIDGPKGVVKTYEIKQGKVISYTAKPGEKFTGEVQMSDDTFLDLMDAAFEGKVDQCFAEKYARKAIRYRGQQWIVDSERFRKVLKRLAHKPIRSLV